jgi:hypothetical protein
MIEWKWLQSADAPEMIEWALDASGGERSKPRLNARTLRLFICACYRANMGSHRGRDSTTRLMLQMLEGAEGIADGRQSLRWEPSEQQPLPLQLDLRRAALLIAAGEHAMTYASILRDVIGNPFRTVRLDPASVTSTAVSLAQAAYENRVQPYGQLDNLRLTILADALEDAGCADADVLEHLRDPGPHVRGCWVIDLLLGKE